MSTHTDISQALIAATSSPELQHYERRLLERVRQALPEFARRLQAAGVATVEVSYDGCGDSGQIEHIAGFGADHEEMDLAQAAGIDKRQLMDLFYDLTQVRHPGWENNDGACGEFHWTITTQALQHTHRDRITDYETTEHDGL